MIPSGTLGGISLVHLVLIVGLAALLSLPVAAQGHEWHCVWGSSGRDVFAIGEEGVILHHDGQTWSAMSSGTTNTLNAIWGTLGGDVFAVGEEGTILHYDGKAWSTVTSAPW